jgi:hypothetical protein
MSFKRTIAIGIAFIALISFYFFYDIKGKPAREEKKHKTNAVFSLKEDGVKDITLVRNMGKITETMVFEKKDGTWYIKLPFEAIADTETLNTLNRTVSKAEKVDTVEDKPSDLNKYGLDKPAYVITLSDGTKQETIFLGALAVGDAKYYAKKKDQEAVFTLDTSFKPNIEKRMVDYRDKLLVHMPFADINKFVCHKGKETLVFEKTGDSWTSKSPGIIRPGNEEILRYIRDFCGMKVKEFIKSTPQKEEELHRKNAMPG